jgi:hypothetical protein
MLERIEKNLICHLSFDNTFNDAQSGMMPVEMKGVTFLENNKNKGIKFNSLGSYLALPFSDKLARQIFTFEAWIKPEVPLWEDLNGEDEHGYIIVHQDSTHKEWQSHNALIIGWSGRTKKFALALADSGVSGTVFSQDCFPAGSPYHVVFTKDSNGYLLYVNGQQQITHATGAIINYHRSEYLTIGSTTRRHREAGKPNYFARTWPGEIYTIKFYDIFLDKEQINILYFAYLSNIRKTFNSTKELIPPKDKDEKSTHSLNTDSAILIATIDGNLIAVERIIVEAIKNKDTSFNINAHDKEAKTAFLIAAEQGEDDILVFLMKSKGINKNARNIYGQNALHLAIKNGHKSTVELLLKSGININAADKEQNTPLHLAAQNNQYDMVELFFAYGAEHTALNKEGKKPIDLASDNNVKSLLDRGESSFWYYVIKHIVKPITDNIGYSIPIIATGVAAYLYRQVRFPAAHAAEIKSSASPLDWREDNQLQMDYFENQEPLVPSLLYNLEAKNTSQPLLGLNTKFYPKASSQKQETQKIPPSKSNISSSFNQSLSTNDYLGAVVPYVAHYTRKYSPFTLTWNRKHDLTDQDMQQLNATLKKRSHLEKNFDAQQKSRVANYEFLSDKVSFVEKELLNLKSDIDGLLDKGKASPSQLAEVQSRLEQVEEVAKQLSVNNKKLRSFEVREKRLAKRSEKTGKQPSTVLHYNVTKNCLTQEIVYDHLPLLPPCESVPLKTKQETSSAGSYRFSQLQQLWKQPAPSSPLIATTSQTQVVETQAKSPMVSLLKVGR